MIAVRNLIPWNRSRSAALQRESANPLVGFYDEMNRLFEQFSGDFKGTGLALGEEFGFPRVEVSETDKDVTVQAKLPGLSEKDIDLELDGGVLTIRGEKKRDHGDERRRVSEVSIVGSSATFRCPLKSRRTKSPPHSRTGC